MLSSLCKQHPGLEDTRLQTKGSNPGAETPRRNRLGWGAYQSWVLLFVHSDNPNVMLFMITARCNQEQFFLGPVGGALLAPAGEELV